MSERPKKTRAARGAIPYALVAAVFLPVGLVYLWWFRSLELLRFAHPAALVLIPLALALVIWAGIRRAPTRHPVLVYSRAGEMALLRRGWAARLADLPMVLRLFIVVPWLWRDRRPHRRTTISSWKASTSWSPSTCRAPWKRPTCNPIVWKRPRP
jgi:hypothetical protein